MASEVHSKRESICYVVGAFPVISETFVYREIAELRRRGYQVVLLCLRPTGQEVPRSEQFDLENLKVISIYDRGMLNLLALAGREFFRHARQWLATLTTTLSDGVFAGEKTSLQLRLKLAPQFVGAMAIAEELRKLQVKRIHCHFAHAPTTIGMYLAEYLQIPFTFTGHANDIFVSRAFLKKKLSRAAGVSAISEWHKQFYSEIAESSEKKIFIVRCGVDTEQWSPIESASGNDEMLRVATVCRLVPKKGTETLIRGLDLAHKKTGVPWNLWIAGDGPERAHLEAVSRSLGCDSRVRFVGSVSNAEVQQICRDCDVFALICQPAKDGDRDGIPVSLIEAMACAVPAMAGKSGTIAELVHDRENGLLLEPENIEAVAEGVALLYSDPDLRRQLGRNARATVVEEFSLRKNVDRLEKMFNIEVDSRPPSNPDRANPNPLPKLRASRDKSVFAGTNQG